MQRDRLLTEVHADVKHLVRGFDLHVQDDKEQFETLRRGQAYLYRILWTAFGGGAVIIFVFNVVHK